MRNLLDRLDDQRTPTWARQRVLAPGTALDSSAWGSSPDSEGQTWRLMSEKIQRTLVITERAPLFEGEESKTFYLLWQHWPGSTSLVVINLQNREKSPEPWLQIPSVQTVKNHCSVAEGRETVSDCLVNIEELLVFEGLDVNLRIW